MAIRGQFLLNGKHLWEKGRILVKSGCYELYKNIKLIAFMGVCTKKS